MIKNKKKIMFLFAHLHKGGMQRAVSNISCALPDNFEQYVVFFGTENPGFEYNARLVNINLPGTLKRNVLFRAIYTVRRLRRLRTFIRQQNIDTVVSMGETANFYSLLSRHKAKKIITSRVAYFDNPRNGKLIQFQEKIARYLYKRADLLVAVSNALGRQFEKMLNKKIPIAVIPNLYHFDRITALAREHLPEQFGFLASKKFILNVGSLCHQKGQDELVEIFGIIKKDFPELYLVIIGRGEWKEKIVKLAEQYEVRDHLVLIGFDGNPYRYMARAQAFVFTSRYEGFPNVLAEAMGCGLPVISFNCPTGPDEILEGGRCGILVRNRSKEQFADAVTELLKDPHARSRLSGLGKQKAVDKYSGQAVISQWVNIL